MAPISQSESKLMEAPVAKLTFMVTSTWANGTSWTFSKPPPGQSIPTHTHEVITGEPPSRLGETTLNNTCLVETTQCIRTE